MNKTLVFAKRNLIELSRDVLGYIFCIAFPIVMLIIMSVVQESIPPQANMTLFRIDNLAGGILMFGQTFVMLFTAILVSTDKNTSFLMRLYSSPMKSSQFTNGYILPMLLIGIIQAIVTVISSFLIAGITNCSISPIGMILSIIAAIPSSLLFISLGLIFGTLFNEKSAPGVCSVLVSLATFLGGVFFDAESTGGVIYKVCKCLPFIYCTKTTRSCIKLNFTSEAFGQPLLITIIVAFVLLFLAITVFNSRMKADQ